MMLKNILIEKCPQRYAYKMQRHTYVKIRKISVSRGYKNEIYLFATLLHFSSGIKMQTHSNNSTFHLCTEPWRAGVSLWLDPH